MPFSLLFLLAGLLWVALVSPYTKPILFSVAVLLLIAGFYTAVAMILQNRKLLKPIRLIQYITAGFIGMAWGAIDFIRGRRLSCAWDPKKTGQAAA